jgi:phage/plasmid-associated DNA primase
VYDAYRDWMQAEGLVKKAVSKIAFGKEVRRVFGVGESIVRKSVSRCERVWEGVEPNPEAELRSRTDGNRWSQTRL